MNLVIVFLFKFGFDAFLAKHNPGPTCLEVETYTWSVLPPQYRSSDLHVAITRELAWTRARLDA